MVYSFRDMVPVVDASAFVHPDATLIGHVTVGPDCYVGPGAVLRGDWGKIVLEEGANVQECCVLHMFPGAVVHLEKHAHIGHGAMIHGAHVGENCLVGMNAVLLDDVVLGSESIVGALALLPANSNWPSRSLIVGNPAQIKGQVSDEMLAHKSEGTSLYQRLPQEAKSWMHEVKALAEIPDDRHEDFPVFETWQARKNRKASKD